MSSCFYFANEIEPQLSYKYLRLGPLELGRLPERLLFPRNLIGTNFLALAFSKINNEYL